MRSATASPLRLPPLAEARLSNGLRVMVACRPGVPLVAVRLVVAAGAALDPPGGHGLSHMVVQVARRGTARRSGRAIDELVESLGSELGAGSDEDASSFGLSAPSEFFPQLLDVVVDVATAPAFPRAEWERIRRREVASLAHLLDEPGAVADRAMVDHAYRGHPYGHAPDGRLRHLTALRRGDALAFHRRWYAPASATLVVVGALEPEAALALARRKLSRWKATAEEAPRLPAPGAISRAVLVLDKPDQTQVQVRIATPGLARAAPGYFAAVVANTVFGGGFTSRLMEAVRVNRGLSYGVRSRFAMSRFAGLFYLSSFTKVESAAELVQVLLDESRRFCEEGPSEAELSRAKGYLTGLHPLSLETHDQVADKLADSALYGFPLTQVTAYREEVLAVSAEACRELARMHLPGEDGLIVAVGPAKQVAPALERFGAVKVLPARRVL